MLRKSSATLPGALRGRLRPAARPVESIGMRWAFVAGALGIVSAAACSSQTPRPERTSATSSPIQGGSNDTSHNFVVGIYNNQYSAVCSGALIAPNLVATARHCVALTTQQIDCATSTFPSPVPAGQMLVTTNPDMGVMNWVSAKKIIVPSGPNTDLVCGNDIALLILLKPISLPEYVTPTITPPMTDSSYSTTITAIGYGVDSPNNTNSAGIRRIKENIGLNCIPNDKAFVDCFADPTARQYMTAAEFMSGDGTCEGDSGSGAFEQKNFNAGNWVSFGVLSRGGVSSDGTTCLGGVYSRFDAWGPLLQQAAEEAAADGSYSVPSWAVSILPNGATCKMDTDCMSNDCYTHDNGNSFQCVPCDDNSPCNTGLVCTSGVCMPDGDAGAGDDGGSGTNGSSPSAHHSGCDVAGAPSPGPSPWRWLALTLGVGGAVLLGRGRRRP